MKYRHFVTGENLKQGVFFISLENKPNSVEAHTRSNKQTESLLFDVGSLLQYGEVFKPLCKIADCSQLNGDLSRNPKQLNGDLR